MRNFIQSVILLTACSFSGFAAAQQIAIVGAEIHTLSPAGTIEQGTVLIKDGKIQQVLSNTKVPNGYQIIDATGKVVTPGLFGALTSLGLVEVTSSAGVTDNTVKAHAVSTVGAAYDASYAVNPDSTLIGISRVEGFTAAATAINRTGQLFNGQGAIITLSGAPTTVVKPRAFVHTRVDNGGANANGESRAALWVALVQVLNESEQATSENLGLNAEWHGLSTKADAKALQRVISGEIPLLVTANRAADIRQVIALKQQFNNLRLVIVDGLEAWRVASELAAADIPVIVNPEYNLPGGFDQLGATLANAGRLFEAGVTVAIGISTHNIRLATQHAGNAVANGLPHIQAIAAITLNPAKIFGVDSTHGSLEPGKQADLVIWSGDPLEVTEAAEQVFIGGEAMPMTSRQIKLKDRYLQLNQAKTQPYVKP